MVVGDRVHQSGAMAEAVRAAELVGARVHAAAFAEVNFPTSHPQFLGALNLNRGQTKDLFAGADVVLAVGANVFQSFLYVPDPFLGPNTTLIHMDSATEESRSVSHPRRHDCRPQVRLGRLVRCVRNPDVGQPEGRSQDAGCDYRRGEAESQGRPAPSGSSQLGRRPHVAGTHDVGDGESSAFRRGDCRRIGHLASGYAERAGVRRAGQHARHPRRRSWMGHGRRPWHQAGASRSSCGGRRRRRASLYTIQALWTAARYNIPVTYVICNNRTYRILKQNMDIYLRDMLEDNERVSDYVGMDFPLPLDVAGIARGFGVEGVQVTKPEDVAPAMERAWHRGSLRVVDVVIDSAPYPCPRPRGSSCRPNRSA